MPAIIEKPVRRERNRGSKQNSNRSDRVCSPNRHGIGDETLDQPTNADPGGNRDRNKHRQIVRILVLRNFVAEVVSQIGNDDKQEKPEGCAVLFESVDEAGEGQGLRQGQPGQAEFTEGHSAEFNKLLLHYLRRKGEEHPILPASDVPPYLLQRTRIAPVDDRRAQRRKRQVGINSEWSAS